MTVFGRCSPTALMSRSKGDVLTVKQLAEVLNIGLNAAYELVNRHEIGAKRIGRAIRIPKSSVIMYLNSARYVVGQNDNSRLPNERSKA